MRSVEFSILTFNQGVWSSNLQWVTTSKTLEIIGISGVFLIRASHVRNGLVQLFCNFF